MATWGVGSRCKVHLLLKQKFRKKSNERHCLWYYSNFKQFFWLFIPCKTISKWHMLTLSLFKWLVTTKAMGFNPFANFWIRNRFHVALRIHSLERVVKLGLRMRCVTWNRFPTKDLCRWIPTRRICWDWSLECKYVQVWIIAKRKQTHSADSSNLE